MKKLLVVDGNSILNRAFYGVKPLSTSEGIPTNAVFGFINILNRNLETVEPDLCAIAFDLKAPTFRHKMYSEYKAGRREMPEELAEQFPYAKEASKILGFNLFELEGYEADDILGTLAAKADADTETYILTGDRDSLQLISDKTKILLATNNEPITYDRAAFFEKYGVEPEQFVDVKALMGDSSDNIPGVAGIGEKTATKLIAQFGSLDALYEAIPSKELSSGVNAKLEAGRDSAFMSRELAKIFTDVPVDVSCEAVCRRELDRDAAYKLFTKLELSSFIKKFSLEGGEETSSLDALPVKDDFKITDGKLIAVSYSDGVLSVCDGEAVCFINDKKAIEEILERCKCVCHDSKELYKRLELDGIHYRNAAYDVMLGAYVLSPGESDYDLSKLVLRYLGSARSENVADAQYIYSIYPEIAEKIRQGGEEGLLSDIEMPTAAVLSDMELYGFKIDREGIAAYGERLRELEN